MIEQYSGWSIAAPDGFLYINSIRCTRSECIEDWMKVFPLRGKFNWPILRRRGWSCVKVRVEKIS